MNKSSPLRFSLPLLAGCACGCVLFPTGGDPTGRPGGEPSPMGRGLRDYRIIFHCHSLLSHDSKGTFEEIAAAASSVGVNGIIMTDHYEPGNIGKFPGAGFFHGSLNGLSGFLFIPGAELRGPAKEGSLLAVGMREDFDKNQPKARLVESFRRQGGLAVAGHCEEIRDWSLWDIDGLEVYNLHAEFSRKSWWEVAWRFLFLPADAFLESSISIPEENLRTWDRLLDSGKRLPALLGSDAHANIRLFGSLGGTIGTYPEILRLFSNHILATELRQDLILDALRRGRVYGAFDWLGDTTGFAMSYGNPAKYLTPEARAILGEALPFDPAATLLIEVPREARLRLLRDGQVWRELTGRRFCEPVDGPGIYRAEVYLGGRLWILSGAIYVERN
ncbi:MAG: PHP domain-containing protein [Planctomycetes bacterium]|nr:PHP domain-containing protein [Planctomycetota bacterium]